MKKYLLPESILLFFLALTLLCFASCSSGGGSSSKGGDDLGLSFNFNNSKMVASSDGSSSRSSRAASVGGSSLLKVDSNGKTDDAMSAEDDVVLPSIKGIVQNSASNDKGFYICFNGTGEYGSKKIGQMLRVDYDGSYKNFLLDDSKLLNIYFGYDDYKDTFDFDAQGRLYFIASVSDEFNFYRFDPSDYALTKLGSCEKSGSGFSGIQMLCVSSDGKFVFYGTKCSDSNTNRPINVINTLTKQTVTLVESHSNLCYSIGYYKESDQFFFNGFISDSTKLSGSRAVLYNFTRDSDGNYTSSSYTDVLSLVNNESGYVDPHQNVFFTKNGVFSAKYVSRENRYYVCKYTKADGTADFVKGNELDVNANGDTGMNNAVYGKYLFFTIGTSLINLASGGAVSDKELVYRYDTESGQYTDVLNAIGASTGKKCTSFYVDDGVFLLGRANIDSSWKSTNKEFYTINPVTLQLVTIDTDRDLTAVLNVK